MGVMLNGERLLSTDDVLCSTLSGGKKGETRKQNKFK